MKTTILLTAMLLLTGLAYGQSAGRTDYENAYDLWDAGEYPAALSGLLELLESNEGDKWVKQVALLTGEWFRTTEIAVDGRNIMWSPDGNYYTYETAGKTHIYSSDHSLVGTITSRQSEFNPSGGEIAYISVTETPEIKSARAAIEEMRRTRNFSAFRSTRSKLIRLEWANSRISIRRLDNGEEKVLDTGNMGVMSFTYEVDGNALLFSSVPENENSSSRIYRVKPSGAPEIIVENSGMTGWQPLSTTGKYLVYPINSEKFGICDLQSLETAEFQGASIHVAKSGHAMVYLADEGAEQSLRYLDLNTPFPPRTLIKTPERLANPVLSADGSKIAFQRMLREDWEIFTINPDGTKETRITYDIQHDIFPAFFSNDLLLGIIGEGRHRRSFMYDLKTGDQVRLFHNNTIRTVAPEYEWAIHPDGKSLLIVSERDGDTISPERAVYRVDLSDNLNKNDIVDRLRSMKTAEDDLRSSGKDLYSAITEEVRNTLGRASETRIFGYARDLHRFGSKFITEPGNKKAIDYLTRTLEDFGYQVDQQWFEPRPGIQSANVIATLPGTVHPDLVYVISSHFDSVRRGPGADDNSSGTTALLEAARIMADTPMPATIQFAFFTGEEAGLLGSREFVRQAVENRVKLLGALNNDMVGWANDNRLDDTIRYSNAGIRDIQHAAAFLFTDLITYDAKYYKSTDAHAYYDAYGDIVGGIGSYPILSSPHYHQSHDVLEIINQKLVTEVSKTTVATIMLMASSPARLKDLAVEDKNQDGYTISWAPALEKDVMDYQVEYGTDSNTMKRQTVADSRVTLKDAKPGMIISVWARNKNNMVSWDRATLTIE